ncbi:MOSC domain-containing protein [Palleronia rufa]|uniref:MOSC domain-containing protein n=1 Tax=Palleronia rufa TaxID=1530186 RepID=UPI0005666595|nr:MOSC domain-containing protein [Palleronia rufa]
MRLEGIRRYPVKGIGREALRTVTLAPDAPLPGDRAWAVTHAGCPEGEGWRPRGNFLVVASGPDLAAVEATSDGDRVALTHPDRPEAAFDLPGDAARLIDWVRPLWPETRPAPADLRRAPESTGMPDNGIASLSVLTRRSLDALSDAAGAALDVARFRGNLILDGAVAWEEFGWVGKRLRVGAATLEVIEPIGRCRATEANPLNGRRDVNILALLRDRFGHTDFGVYARVVDGGRIAVGDAAALS